MDCLQLLWVSAQTCRCIVWYCREDAIDINGSVDKETILGLISFQLFTISGIYARRLSEHLLSCREIAELELAAVVVSINRNLVTVPNG